LTGGTVHPGPVDYNVIKNEKGVFIMADKAAQKTDAAKMKKGDAYLCEVCGLQVNVDICGEFLASKGPSCCGKKMKPASGATKK
jgi:hypothetical protein